MRVARLPKKKVPTRALNAVGTKGGRTRSSPGIIRRANPLFEGAPKRVCGALVACDRARRRG